MTQTIPADRMQLIKSAPRQFAAMYSTGGLVEPEQGLTKLIKVHTSQVNDAPLIDMR